MGGVIKKGIRVCTFVKRSMGVCLRMRMYVLLYACVGLCTYTGMNVFTPMYLHVCVDVHTYKQKHEASGCMSGCMYIRQQSTGEA
jgi:hypothetical protein